MKTLVLLGMALASAACIEDAQDSAAAEELAIAASELGRSERSELCWDTVGPHWSKLSAAEQDEYVAFVDAVVDGAAGRTHGKTNSHAATCDELEDQIENCNGETLVGVFMNTVCGQITSAVCDERQDECGGKEDLYDSVCMA